MLAFLQTRIGVGLVAAVLAALATFTVTARYYNRAAEVASLNRQVSDLQAKNDVLANDISIAKEHEEKAQATAANLTQEVSEHRSVIDELEKELESATAICRAAVPDVKRLLNAK